MIDHYCNKQTCTHDDISTPAVSVIRKREGREEGKEGRIISSVFCFSMEHQQYLNNCSPMPLSFSTPHNADTKIKAVQGCESAYCLYLIYLCTMHTFLNFSEACDFQGFFKCVNTIMMSLMNSRHTALFQVSERCKEWLRFPGELPVSHVTLINISQSARMVCYLNFMNF